jgi:hypothetical protein
MLADRLLGYGDAMVERVEALDLGVVWDPNAPEAILASNDRGRTVLALNPRHDDEDQRCVVLVWTGTRSACVADPNDESDWRTPALPEGPGWCAVLRERSR